MDQTANHGKSLSDYSGDATATTSSSSSSAHRRSDRSARPSETACRTDGAFWKEGMHSKPNASKRQSLRQKGHEELLKIMDVPGLFAGQTMVLSSTVPVNCCGIAQCSPVSFLPHISVSGTA